MAETGYTISHFLTFLDQKKKKELENMTGRLIEGQYHALLYSERMRIDG